MTKRNKAVKNMLIMVGTIFCVEVYASVYSVLLYFWANDNCYIQDTVWVKSLSTFMERSSQYLVWIYPVLCLMWPSNLTVRR